MKKISIIFALLAMSLFAQDVKDEWKFGGQLQLRTELDGRDFLNKSFAPVFTTLRTRVDVQKKFSDVEFFVQFQDSRIFGSEANTSSNEKNIDLRQGYVKLVNPFGIPFSVQAGRFEMSYGTERFFGAVGWNYIGRSFDGVRFTMNEQKYKLHLFGLTISQSGGIVTAATPGSYKYPEDPDMGTSVYGAWYRNENDEANTFDVLGYYELNRNQTNKKDNDLNRFLFALSHWGKYGALSTVTEAAYQTGKVGAKTQGAYLLSVSANYAADVYSFGLGADILSGNKPTDTDKSNCFDTRYGTGHKFFGYMDYFTSFPAHTGNLGVNDLYASVNFVPKGNPFNAQLTFHNFTSNQKSAADLSSYGQEFDLTLRYQFAKSTLLTFGQSIFLPGDLMKANFKTVLTPREDMAFWSFVMISTAL